MQFLKIFAIFSVLIFLRHCVFLRGLIINCCIISRVRGRVINFFDDSSFFSFLIKLYVLKFSENFSFVPSVWIFEPVILFQACKMDTG